MSFMDVSRLRAVSFDVFTDMNVDFLDQLKRDIDKAVENGHVSMKVSFYVKENKDMAVEHRETLVSYLREEGFKTDYRNNELTVFWGVNNL